MFLFRGIKHSILDSKSLKRRYSVLTPIIIASYRFVQALVKWSIFLSEAVSLSCWGLSWNQPFCFTLPPIWLVRKHCDVDTLWHDNLKCKFELTSKVYFGVLLPEVVCLKYKRLFTCSFRLLINRSHSYISVLLKECWCKIVFLNSLLVFIEKYVPLKGVRFAPSCLKKSYFPRLYCRIINNSFILMWLFQPVSSL